MSTSRKLLIQKFGGTSVATTEARSAAIQRIEHNLRQGYQVVVVVSAIGRMGQPYATDTLVHFAQDIAPGIAPRELDMLMACGELISTVIMAHQLRNELQIPTVALSGGQAGISTDANYGRARIVKINPRGVMQHLEEGKLPVVAGFQGAREAQALDLAGDMTTLGRGGSDTTASALGVALKAELVEIYTDVEGVFTADPALVPEARLLPEITYDEICEMAYQGARVVHPRAVEIAKRHSVPMRVRSTFSSAPGTLVSACESKKSGDAGQRIVSGVVHSAKVRLLELRIKNLTDDFSPEEAAELAKRAELEVYRLIGQAGINLYFVARSPRRVKFVVGNEQIHNISLLFNGMVVPLQSDGDRAVLGLLNCAGTPGRFEAQCDLFTHRGFRLLQLELRMAERCRIVSVIGPDLQHVPGIIPRATGALAKEDVQILQTSGAERAFSMLIPEEFTGKAVRALHEEFFH